MDKDLSSAIELLPGRLFYICVRNVPRSSDRALFFSMDHELLYMRFFNDFGPLNLSQTYRFCATIHRKLQENGSRPLYYYTGNEPQRRANVACLLCLYLVLVHDYDPESAYMPFSRARTSFIPFRDASMNPCTFNLTIPDCLRAAAKAKKNGWINLMSFNLQEYEHYEKMENGDMNWIIPNKFLAFSGPQALPLKSGFRTHPPEFYVPTFKKLGVVSVVRLNNKCYERKKFVESGIQHYDLYFPDGSTPSDAILYRFLEIAEKDMGAIAVHCKAGLGRTGTLIASYIMKHFKLTAAEVIGWIRLCRPGSIIGPQQHYLQSMQPKLWKLGEGLAEMKSPHETSFGSNDGQAENVRSPAQLGSTEVPVRKNSSEGTILPPAIIKRQASSSQSEPNSLSRRGGFRFYGNSEERFQRKTLSVICHILNEGKNTWFFFFFFFFVSAWDWIVTVAEYFGNCSENGRLL
eukprot:TRINITY_DN5770_c0_g1_i10.p1 TRINITY_DN5770_c0_g1~~TRINITY_DN5770_c0_g1_i10.p1  ORF type:complete len:462 (-),score=68.57 TRINITY_DN5770_c0_g1_i10:180-1565(-)